MEQVLFRLHVRIISTTCCYTNRRVRVAIEHFLLFLAFASLVVLYLLHCSYISTNGKNCLAYSLAENNLQNIEMVSKDFDIMRVEIDAFDWASAAKFPYDQQVRWPEWSNKLLKNEMIDKFMEAASKFGQVKIHGGGHGEASQDQSYRRREYLFSLERGYLMLRSDVMAKHNMSVFNVRVEGNSDCFGSPLYALILHSLVGYDSVVKNWVIKSFGGKGYLYNVHANEIFDLGLAAEFVAKTGNAGSTGILSSAAAVSSSSSSSSSAAEAAETDGEAPKWLQWISGGSRKLGSQSRGPSGSVKHYFAFKVGVLVTTLFLFFTTTTLVSFTLRVTQERMLKFTFMLQHHISRRLPYGDLVFTHVVESLVFVPLIVGILFFLFEFYLDQLLAFLVLSTVWCAEVYSVVSLRTVTSTKFFPKVFFFYFCLFHVYFFCFPFGFSYIALSTAGILVAHAMLFFWNRYEVPAFECGLVTAVTPRLTPSASDAFSTTGYDFRAATQSNASTAMSSSASSSGSQRAAGEHVSAAQQRRIIRDRGRHVQAQIRQQSGTAAGRDSPVAMSYDDSSASRRAGSGTRLPDGRIAGISTGFDPYFPPIEPASRHRLTSQRRAEGSSSSGNGARGGAVDTRRGISTRVGSLPGSDSPGRECDTQRQGQSGNECNDVSRGRDCNSQHDWGVGDRDLGVEQREGASPARGVERSVSQHRRRMREACSRHVELSRRIQQQEMSAMLGMRIDMRLSPERERDRDLGGGEGRDRDINNAQFAARGGSADSDDMFNSDSNLWF